MFKMQFFTILDSTGKILWVSGIDQGMDLTREQMHGNACMTFIQDAKPWAERCGAAILLNKSVEFEATMTDYSQARNYKVRVEPIQVPGHAQLVAVATRVVEHNLTENEVQIAILVAQDFTQKEIAEKFGITVSTIGSHCTKIRKKLGVRGTAGITRFVLNAGLLNGESNGVGGSEDAK